MTILKEIKRVVGEKGLITGEDVLNRKAGIYGEGGNGEGGVRYGGGPGGYGPGKGGGGSKDPYGDGGHGSSIGGQAIQNGGDIFSYPGDSQRRVAGKDEIK